MTNIKSKPYFILYASCIPVKGAARSVICDLQRNDFLLITNDMYELLTSADYYTVETLSDEALELINELEEQELGFYTDEPTLFPKLQLQWESPRRFTNAIVDIDKDSDHSFEIIREELDSVGVGALELRFYDKVSTETLTRIIETFSLSRLRSIYITLPFTAELTSAFLDELVRENERITRIIISGANQDGVAYTQPNNNAILIYSTQLIKDASCCGNIAPAYFTPNIELFSESMQFNNCLNRKISVDRQGNIKNCPSMVKGFGTVTKGAFLQLSKNTAFRELWDINKDKIEVCRDCEFRYICTDCRAYVTTSEDKYSKPGKCSYDPYTATWEE